MALLGTHRTLTASVSPGVTPSASLVATGLGAKLSLDLGSTVLLISLGADPRAALEAIRDDLNTILSESKEAA